MFPFHTWLPDAHTEAPTVGSVLLAAILLKLGTYGFIRIALPILPKAAHDWAPWIGLLAVIGIIYGALCCLAQTDMKRLIAFSSVAHMGFVMLGIATLTTFGINAAIFGMVAHGLITGMLFFVAGSVQHTYGTREMSRLGGLLKQAPKMGWILGFCAMASLGLPGLAGFWGEFPAVLSAYNPAQAAMGLFGGNPDATFRIYMVVAAVGTVLAAGYLALDVPAGRVRRAQSRVRGRAHPRRQRDRVDRVDPDADRDPGARPLPEHHLQRHGQHGHPPHAADRDVEATMNSGWDFHAIAPEIVISATIIVVLIADFFFEYRRRFQTSQLATFGVLAAHDPGRHAGRRRRHAPDVRRRVRRRSVLARAHRASSSPPPT